VCICRWLSDALRLGPNSTTSISRGFVGRQVVQQAVHHLDTRGREFDSRRVRCQVTTLGKLFTPTCLCRCTWSSGWCQLVTFRLRFDSHRGSFASNLEQVANLLHAQVNSASYPQRDGKWVVAYGLRDKGLVWLIWAVVCLLAATADPIVRWRGQWMAA